MKAIAGLIALALLSSTVSARAEDASPPPGCEVPANLLTTDNTLKKVAEAVKTTGRLDIMVIGSRSATVVAADGTGFPGRMEVALRDKLPTIKVNVNLQLQIKKTAGDVVNDLNQILEGKQPTCYLADRTVDACERSIRTISERRRRRRDRFAKHARMSS
jgi:hypothetical protein